MLDVLQDYMRMAEWPVERIDGSVKSRDRQAAIDRFTNGKEGGWSVVLATGGYGVCVGVCVFVCVCVCASLCQVNYGKLACGAH